MLLSYRYASLLSIAWSSGLNFSDRDSSVSFECISRRLCMFDSDHSQFSWGRGRLVVVRGPKARAQNAQGTCGDHHSEASAQSWGISSMLKHAIVALQAIAYWLNWASACHPNLSSCTWGYSRELSDQSVEEFRRSRMYHLTCSILRPSEPWL